MWWTKGPSADEMARLRAVLGFNDVKVLAHGRGDGAIVIAVTEGLVVLTDVVLSKPGKIPEVFRAKITESIAATRTVPVHGGNVLIAGRIPAGRLADADGAIAWTAVARDSADLNDPETRQAVMEATDSLKNEWG